MAATGARQRDRRSPETIARETENAELALTGRARCTQCREVKDLSEYSTRRTGRQAGQRIARCTTCCSAASRSFYAANRARQLARIASKNEYLRAAVLGWYGNSCTCCGSADRLALDHVNGNGREHRIELFGGSGQEYNAPVFYKWVIKHGFPDDLATLCARCNSSKAGTASCRLDHHLAA